MSEFYAIRSPELTLHQELLFDAVMNPSRSAPGQLARLSPQNTGKSVKETIKTIGSRFRSKHQ